MIKKNIIKSLIAVSLIQIIIIIFIPFIVFYLKIIDRSFYLYFVIGIFFIVLQIYALMGIWRKSAESVMFITTIAAINLLINISITKFALIALPFMIIQLYLANNPTLRDEINKY